MLSPLQQGAPAQPGGAALASRLSKVATIMTLSLAMLAGFAPLKMV